MNTKELNVNEMEQVNGGSVLAAVSCELHSKAGVSQLRIKDGVGNIQSDSSFRLPDTASVFPV